MVSIAELVEVRAGLLRQRDRIRDRWTNKPVAGLQRIDRAVDYMRAAAYVTAAAGMARVTAGRASCLKD